MILHVDPERRSHEVRDVDDLKRFSVVVSGEASVEEVGVALAPLASLQSDAHALVSVDLLRSACKRDNDQAWQEAFEAMIQFAASKGWTDDTGAFVRAHVVHVPA